MLHLLASAQVFTKPDLPEALDLAARSADMFAKLSCPLGQAKALVVSATPTNP